MRIFRTVTVITFAAKSHALPEKSVAFKFGLLIHAAGICPFDQRPVIHNRIAESKSAGKVISKLGDCVEHILVIRPPTGVGCIKHSFDKIPYFSKKMCPVQLTNYAKNDRTTLGHQITAIYISTISL